MGEWKTIELSPALCEIISGSTPSTSDTRYWGGENVWITPNDLSNLNGYLIGDSMKKLTTLGVKRSTGKLLPANSVIISCRAPVGYCAVSSVPFSMNQGCKALIHSIINESYLYYFLSKSTNSLERVSSGTTFLELPKKELARFKIFCPSDQKEQSKIAEILTTVDEAIENSRSLIEKYINIKTGMMQSLLGDFACENYEKLSVLGNVQIINGGTPNTQNNNYWNGSIGWLSVEDFNTWHRYVFKAQKKITKAGLKNSSTKILKKGQVIISARGTVGVVAQIGCDLAFNQSCYGLNSIVYWSNDFLYYYLSFISDRIRSITHGNVFGTIIKNTFKDIYIPLFPRPIQDEIVDALSSADIKIETERDYLVKLQNIKQGLMQDLLTNTVSVDSLL